MELARLLATNLGSVVSEICHFSLSNNNSVHCAHTLNVCHENLGKHTRCTLHGGLKNFTLLYYCNNFVHCLPIFITFGRHNFAGNLIYNKMIIVNPPHLVCVTAPPCNFLTGLYL